MRESRKEDDMNIKMILLVGLLAAFISIPALAQEPVVIEDCKLNKVSGREECRDVTTGERTEVCRINKLSSRRECQRGQRTKSCKFDKWTKKNRCTWGRR